MNSIIEIDIETDPQKRDDVARMVEELVREVRSKEVVGNITAPKPAEPKTPPAAVR